MKRHAPATLRNRDAIAEVLALELPGRGTVLEVASGTGEHAIFFAEKFPALDWQASDADPEAIASIAAYRAECDLPNLLPPLRFSATDAECPLAKADAMFCANMIHISPWAAAEGLFRHAGSLLVMGAPLILYGPFSEPDVPTAVSNLEFDASLKARDPAWGLRSLEAVDDLAAEAGLTRTARHTMPANNLALVYRRDSRDAAP